MWRFSWTTESERPVPAAHDHGQSQGARPEAGAGTGSEFSQLAARASRICSLSAPGICWTWSRTNGRSRCARTIAELDLTYYFPCTVRGRTIAYLALSRTDKGDFLSSDDVELLTTLAGYVSIAVENARLYRSLQRKVEEYERLKEFSENIVESINVGHSGGGSGRSRGELEHADRAADRHSARSGGGPAAGASCSRPSCASEFDQVRGRDRRAQHLQVRAARAGAAWRTAMANGNGNGNGACAIGSAHR